MYLILDRMEVLMGNFSINRYEWTSSCASINLQNELQSYLVQDGKLQNFEVSNIKQTKSKFIRGGGIVFLGQDQDGLGKFLDRQQSLKAFVADFRWYFNNTFEESLLKQWTLQPNVTIPKTPLMSFDNFDDFTNSEITLLNVDNEDEFYPARNHFKKFFPKALEFKKAEKFCYAVGGYMILPKNEEENKKLLDDLSESPAMCHDDFRFQSSIWLGAYIENHTVIHHATRKPIVFSNFKNDISLRNVLGKCLSFNGCKKNSLQFWGEWSMKMCKFPRKVVCSFQEKPTFQIRGLKQASVFDIEFVFNDDFMNPKFVGKFNSIIEEVKESNKTKFWKLYYLNDPKVQAVTFPSPVYNYPIGYQTWNITNDDTFEGSLQLCFSSCSSTEFTCYDGSCIDRTKRCDLEKHCLDGSDENNCDLIKFPEAGYNPSIPPSIPELQSKHQIKVQINFRRVRKLTLDSFKLIADISSTLQWSDSDVKFLNLKEDLKMNVIPNTSKMIPWVPECVIRGYNFSLTDIKEFNSKLMVVKESQPELDDTSDIYSGKSKGY